MEMKEGEGARAEEGGDAQAGVLQAARCFA